MILFLIINKCVLSYLILYFNFEHFFLERALTFKPSSLAKLGLAISRICLLPFTLCVLVQEFILSHRSQTPNKMSNWQLSLLQSILPATTRVNVLKYQFIYHHGMQSHVLHRVPRTFHNHHLLNQAPLTSVLELPPHIELFAFSHIHFWTWCSLSLRGEIQLVLRVNPKYNLLSKYLLHLSITHMLPKHLVHFLFHIFHFVWHFLTDKCVSPTNK